MHNLSLILITIISSFLFFIAVLVFLLKKNIAIYLIIITLFLEASIFSFYLLGARIRIVQIIEIIVLFCIFIRFSIGKFRFLKTPIDVPLFGYLLINFIAIINSPSIYRSLKISILLLSLALLYYIIVNYIDNKELFVNAFNLLLYVGLLEIIYGLYQVVAGIFNHYFNTNLYIGYLGLMHAEFINSPWGRPYGTFIEPDWYGAVAMFFSLLFISLYFSQLRERKKLYLFGMIISILGMFLSFVRISWVGFLVGMIFLLIFRPKVKLSKLNVKNFTKFFFYFIVFFLLFIFLTPNLLNILNTRFTFEGDAGISVNNIRFIQFKHALKLFLNSPIIGNGPGCFSVLGGEKDYGMLRFDLSIVTTVLADTGILGAIFFIILSFSFFKYNLLTIPKINGFYQVVSFSLLGGIIGLFISYIFTQGFWIPFTWVFLGFNISALRIGLVDKSKE